MRSQQALDSLREVSIECGQEVSSNTQRRPTSQTASPSSSSSCYPSRRDSPVVLCGWLLGERRYRLFFQFQHNGGSSWFNGSSR